MKRVVVCGANGLIGSHLCHRLSKEGFYVVGLSRSPWRHGENPCDDYWTCDLRDQHFSIFQDADQVYQLACEVGGIGYIADESHDADMLRNSTLIDINVLEAARHYQIPDVFFASSACVYWGDKAQFNEGDAYPENPTNAFAAQKLFAEKLYRAYTENYGVKCRIGRIFNTYGPGMTWRGGREKSVAALCRKVAEASDGQCVEVWGNGSQQRSYTYVDDTVEGIWRLMQSDFVFPLNIGPERAVTIRELFELICAAAGKNVLPAFNRYRKTGVHSIVSNNRLIRDVLCWEPAIPVAFGIGKTYPWVEQQVLDKGPIYKLDPSLNLVYGALGTGERYAAKFQ